MFLFLISIIVINLIFSYVFFLFILLIVTLIILNYVCFFILYVILGGGFSIIGLICGGVGCGFGCRLLRSRVLCIRLICNLGIFLSLISISCSFIGFAVSLEVQLKEYESSLIDRTRNSSFKNYWNLITSLIFNYWLFICSITPTICSSTTIEPLYMFSIISFNWSSFFSLISICSFLTIASICEESLLLLAEFRLLFGSICHF